QSPSHTHLHSFPTRRSSDLFPVAEDNAIAPASNIMRRDPPITCRYSDAPRPCSSLKTRIPHSNTHNWLEFDSGMPRLIPAYLTACCWNTSPITQTPPQHQPKENVFCADKLAPQGG